MGAIGMTLRALWIPLSCLVAATAWADTTTSRWSFGTQVGQARGKANAELPAGELSTLSYDVSATFGEKDRFGWRVFTGYRFTDYLALQVGYTDLGEVQSRRADAERGMIGLPYPGLVRQQTIRGIDAGLQLKVPVSDRVAMDVRGGRYYWQSRTTTSSLSSGDYQSSRRDSDLFYGFGMEVTLVDEFSATAGWTRYEVAGEPVDLWTLGALFRFSMY